MRKHSTLHGGRPRGIVIERIPVDATFSGTIGFEEHAWKQQMAGAGEHKTSQSPLNMWIMISLITGFIVYCLNTIQKNQTSYVCPAVALVQIGAVSVHSSALSAAIPIQYRIT